MIELVDTGGRVDVIVGTQFGDEGKGAEVDRRAEDYDLIVRYMGGGNAGHTLAVNDPQTNKNSSMALHLIPSGVRWGKALGIGAGVIVDPLALIWEIATVRSFGFDPAINLTIDGRCSLVMIYHRVMDMAKEIGLGKKAIGTTARGIGPTYSEIAERTTIRLYDFLSPDFKDILREKLVAQEKSFLALGINTQQWQEIFEQLTAKEIQANKRLVELGIYHQGEFDYTHFIRQDRVGFNHEEVLAAYLSAAEIIRSWDCVGDVSEKIHSAVLAGQNVLVEGAQGTHLDLFFGTWPYVTSSHPISGGACIGLGISPTLISGVRGVAKAYTTRVGNGPFPTKMADEPASQIRGSGEEIGDEYGSTTRRPRDIGWFDAVLVRSACRWNGVTSITLTKLDMLSHLSQIPIGIAYLEEGEEILFMPANHRLFRDGWPIPKYFYLPGWQKDISGVRNWDDLPPQAQVYVETLEKLINQGALWPVRIDRIGVGPQPDQFIDR